MHVTKLCFFMFKVTLVTNIFQVAHKQKKRSFFKKDKYLLLTLIHIVVLHGTLINILLVNGHTHISSGYKPFGKNKVY